MRAHGVVRHAEVTGDVPGGHALGTGLDEQAEDRQARFLGKGAERLGCSNHIHMSRIIDINTVVKARALAAARMALYAGRHRTVWSGPMPTREGALSRAASFFDDGGFKSLLSDLVAIPSTAQEEGRDADLDRYLNGAIRPWLEGLGFTVQVRPNPRAGFGPILTGIRIEDASRPTVLLYGH